MIEQAKKTFKRLIFDDSGVAVAFTVMVFLVFFMLCVSVFAMTENIRQKMELQNACDAAAYSASVVQADMLSRMAVLNRALSWTYLHTNRLQMDYLVGEWANMVHNQHTDDSATVREANVPGCGAHGIKGTNYYASSEASSNYKIVMRNHTERADNVKRQVSQDWLQQQINIGNTNMNTIMAEQTNIRNMMQIWINDTVNYVWSRNGMSAVSQFQLFLNGAVFSSENPATYFADVNDEATLLAFAGFTADDMLEGQGLWWMPSIGKIQRYYNNGLYSYYKMYSEQWECDMYGHRHVSTIPNYDTYPRLTLDYSSIQVHGCRLSPQFFGQAGSIVVAAKRAMANPLELFLNPADARTGFYGVFNGTGKDMWAVSAARAGIRLAENRGTPGHYLVQYPGEPTTRTGYTGGVWNLSEDDWDGVLIPVGRAWNATSPGAWTGSTTATNLLNAVKTGLSVNTDFSGDVGDFMRH